MITDSWFEHYRALQASDLPRRWVRFIDEAGGEWLQELVLSDAAWWPLRQVNPSDGLPNRPRYGVDHPEDRFGMLADQPLEATTDGGVASEPGVEEIDAETFERGWNAAVFR